MKTETTAIALIIAAVFFLSRGKGGGSVNPRRMTSGAAWVPEFEAFDIDPATATMLGRWIGFESGGKPRAVSSLGERGLLQLSPKTRAAAGFTDDEWASLIDPRTPKAEHVRLALKQLRFHVQKAKQYVQPFPDNAGAAMFFAKLHHAYPKTLAAIGNQALARDAWIAAGGPGKYWDEAKLISRGTLDT